MGTERARESGANYLSHCILGRLVHTGNPRPGPDWRSSRRHVTLKPVAKAWHHCVITFLTTQCYGYVLSPPFSVQSILMHCIAHRTIVFQVLDFLNVAQYLYI